MTKLSGAPERADQSLTTERIVPALIDGQSVYLPCPSWCTIDHVRSGEKFLEDVWHSGEFFDLEAPRRNGTPSLLAYARVGLDPFSRDEEMRSPFIFVEDGNTAEGSYLGSPEAKQFAANLIAFGEKIMAMADAIEGEVAA